MTGCRKTVFVSRKKNLNLILLFCIVVAADSTSHARSCELLPSVLWKSEKSSFSQINLCPPASHSAFYSVAGSLPSPSTAILPSTLSIRSFASVNQPQSPSPITHLATARTPFPFDRISRCRSIPAVSNKWQRSIAWLGQKLITCLGSCCRQPHPAWDSASVKKGRESNYLGAKLNRERAFTFAETFM